MHWIVVASQKEARIFRKSSSTGRLILVTTFENPLGGERRRNLIRKEAGRGVKSFGRVGAVTYSQTKRNDPVDEAVKQFARDLSRFLDAERLKKSFESMTMVAEPRLLGKIRAEMSSDLLHSVSRWMRKDLQKTPRLELQQMLLSKAGGGTAARPPAQARS